MKQKSIGVLSIILICMNVNISSMHSNQSDMSQWKSSFQLYQWKNNFIQEKSKYQYIGAEKCALICHNSEEAGFQFNVWKNGPHSKAFNTLSSERAILYAKRANLKENPRESSVCLKCHVTGGGLDASYFAATYKKEDGVTCEAYHKQKYVAKTFLPKETDCLECHNNSAHRMHKFNFGKGCLRIEHLMPKNPEK
jgi:hypothetical protein